ncbi:MAG: murein hydrolase activator EnvC family protein [Solirubrobacterales bacterium]
MAAAVLAGALLIGSFAASGSAPGQSIQGQINEKKTELGKKKDRKGVLSTEIAGLSEKITRLESEVAALRNKEAAAQAELDETEAKLRDERDRLETLRERLRRSIKALEGRLVAIYKSEDLDLLTVVLESDGFDDILERYEYLRRVEEQDADVVGTVRELKEETRLTVERVRDARDRIEEKRQELAETRAQLERQEAELGSAREERRTTLGQVENHIERLEGNIEGLEDQLQAQLQAAAPPTAPQLPAGPIQGGGSAGFIWPVNGPVTSGSGPRWGRLHAGIDVSAPAGTPIRAVKGGSVVLASPYGGYGNFICIAHGGGLSTCYAHLSSYAVRSGSVSQGQVIGNVGCTGHCFGNHLHFEVRINGSAVDPLGYL